MSSRLISRPRYLSSTIDQQYEPVFLGTQGVTPSFFVARFITSACLLAATLAPRARAIHRPPPSATAPHRLPVTWRVPTLPATTRIVRARDASGPASILARHS